MTKDSIDTLEDLVEKCNALEDRIRRLEETEDEPESTESISGAECGRGGTLEA